MTVNADDLPQRHGQCVIPIDTRTEEREREKEREIEWPPFCPNKCNKRACVDQGQESVPLLQVTVSQSAVDQLVWGPLEGQAVPCLMKRQVTPQHLHILLLQGEGWRERWGEKID